MALGFPKEVVQTYINENPRASLEQVILEVVKLLEVRESDKEKNSGVAKKDQDEN